jgi:hypothetical protein
MPWHWINAVRRNHAVEHATVAVMLGQIGPTVRLVGRAVPDGFYIYGRVPSDVIHRSAEEALARLKRGESNLAITPLCGTNLAVAGIIAGALSVLTMGSRRRLDRLPSVFLSATFGVLLSQPLGRMIQKYVTTRPDVGSISLNGIETSHGGLVHKVRTTATRP